MPNWCIAIKYISGVYLFLIGLFIYTNSNLQRHPYQLISIACFTDAAEVIHYIMPTLIFSLSETNDPQGDGNGRLLYYLLAPIGVFQPYEDTGWQ